MTYSEYVDQYLDSLHEAARKLDREAFGRAIEALRDAYAKDRQIFIIGNGGSAATANHFVCDFGKNAAPLEGARRFRIISLSDNVEKITAFGNDISFDEIFRQQLINLMNDGDVLITVSASGNSPDIVKACEYAKERRGTLIAITGMGGGKSRAMADISLHVPVENYEQAEDAHLIILHMFVDYIKKNRGYVLGLSQAKMSA
ncbi:MAG: SIS domain-containing protein [Synergistaceae bacterium]|jgi:D-sedoheptulose 7-phosphate isomerase|nr:SIS domain-containing protein [Synergistaceae bacterium]